MPKILLISKSDNLIENITKTLEDEGFTYRTHSNPDIEEKVSNFLPDLILIDEKITIRKDILKKIKNEFNPQIVAVLRKEDANLMNNSDAFLIMPFSKNIFLSLLSNQLKIKTGFDELKENNNELRKSFYQLNVLYNTSSEFAGTLDIKKLFETMISGLDKILNFELSSTLILKEDEAELVFNSHFPLSERLENALVLRALYNYNLKDTTKKLSIKDIKIVKNIKQEGSLFDLEIFNFDKLSSSIEAEENFWGTVEIFRQKPFDVEDTSCFQNYAKQIISPLRSSTLYNEIIQSNLQLKRLERLKSEFISIVSHELRTPLTSINSSLDIIATGKLDTYEKMKKFVDMAKRNAVQLAGIINGLLDLSKAEAGKLDFLFSEIKIDGVIEGVKNNLEHLAKQKQIDLKIELQDTKTVYADEKRLAQVLTNLLSNAIKFTPENGKIKISSEILNSETIESKKLITKGELSGDYVVITVEDNGIGIKEEDIPKAFDMFLQIENSLSRKVGGTGLGLTITKRLVERHLGAIWVESKEKEGSKFSFAIPSLNHEKVFALDVSRLILNSKKADLIIIKEGKDCGFIEEVKKEGIIKKPAAFKEFEEKNLYIICVAEVENSVLNFIEKRLETSLEQNKTKYQNCGILCSIIACSKETDINKLITKAKQGT